MIDSLAAWFGRFCERNPNIISEKRSYCTPKQLCIACGFRRISRGKSKACVYARKQSLCRHCYTSGDAVPNKKNDTRLPKGVCRACRVRPVAKGDTKACAYAAKQGLCLSCHSSSHLWR